MPTTMRTKAHEESSYFSLRQYELHQVQRVNLSLQFVDTPKVGTNITENFWEKQMGDEC